MNEIILECLFYLSFFIGIIGTIIIATGVARSVLSLCFRRQTEMCFPHARLLLSSHIVLGLDFFVAKDIIDMAFLVPEKTQWIHLLSLVTIVGVRILLTFFLLRELKDLEKKEKEHDSCPLSSSKS